jgi:hypothetical protein
MDVEVLTLSFTGFACITSCKFLIPLGSPKLIGWNKAFYPWYILGEIKSIIGMAVSKNCIEELYSGESIHIRAARCSHSFFSKELVNTANIIRQYLQ